MPRSPSRHRGRRLAALAGVTAVVGSFCVAGATPAQASEPVSGRAATCLDPHELGAGTGGAAAARGGRAGADHRDLSAKEQAAIEKRTKEILANKRKQPGGTTPAAGAGVPVYVHVMADANGNGDVTDAQITQQIAVLNKTYAGGESSRGGEHRLHVHPGRHRPLLQHTVAPGQAEHDVPRADPQGRRQRAEHLAGRLRLPRHRDVPVGLREQPEDRRHPGAVLLAAGRLGHQLQPGQDRHARGRPLVRALPHVPGRLHDHERRGRATPRRRAAPPAAARRAATPARCRASTRSTTTWTTPTTPATTSSPRARATRMQQMFSAYRA